MWQSGDRAAEEENEGRRPKQTSTVNVETAPHSERQGKPGNWAFWTGIFGGLRGADKSPEADVPSLFPPDDGSPPTSDRILEQMKFVPRQLKNGTAVIYLPQPRGWGVQLGTAEFVKGNCPVRNCRLSGNASEKWLADAVLFRQTVAGMETPGPPRRRAEQIWILYILESPNHSGSYKAYDRQINWTATYRWDSDLVTPYERFTYTKDVPADQRVKGDVPSRRKDYAIGTAEQD